MFSNNIFECPSASLLIVVKTTQDVTAALPPMAEDTENCYQTSIIFLSPFLYEDLTNTHCLEAGIIFFTVLTSINSWAMNGEHLSEATIKERQLANM